MSSPIHYPSEDPTFGPLHVGNVHDDDPQVTDSFLVEVDAPPAAEDLIGPIDPEPLVKPTPCTRMETGTYIVDSTWMPVQVANDDPTRKQLRIRGMSTATTPGVNDYVMLAYDRGPVSGGLPNSAVYKLRHNVGIDLDEHTGSVWIGVQSALTATFEITYLIVTEGPNNDN